MSVRPTVNLFSGVNRQVSRSKNSFFFSYECKQSTRALLYWFRFVDSSLLWLLNSEINPFNAEETARKAEFCFGESFR
jgi:hypothetical protein